MHIQIMFQKYNNISAFTVLCSVSFFYWNWAINSYENREEDISARDKQMCIFLCKACHIHNLQRTSRRGEFIHLTLSLRRSNHFLFQNRLFQIQFYWVLRAIFVAIDERRTGRRKVWCCVIIFPNGRELLCNTVKLRITEFLFNKIIIIINGCITKP